MQSRGNEDMGDFQSREVTVGRILGNEPYFGVAGRAQVS